MKHPFTILLAALVSSMILAGEPAVPSKSSTPSPVFIVLHTQFYDFMNPAPNEARVELNLRLLKNLQRQYGKQAVSAVFDFSGAFADKLWSQNKTSQMGDSIMAAVSAGLIEIGYSGEHEPTYRNRPKANLKAAKSPEDRWLAYSKAAESFLRDSKDTLTGVPDPVRIGGLKRVQELFGPARWVAHFSPLLGGDGPYLHQLSRLSPEAVLLGLPDPDPSRGIVGYRGSLLKFGPELMGPLPATSSEMYWEGGFLRVSETSTADIRRMTTDEGPEVLKTLLTKLDRSHVRILQLELGSYNRLFQTWHDGVVKFPPLVWAFDHPEDPTPSTGVPVWRKEMPDKEVAAEEAALKYLFEEFLPANPGSRVISLSELRKLADNPAEQEIPSSDIEAAARGMLEEFSQSVYPPSYARSGDRFFSLAESFQLLVRGLAAEAQTGAKPRAIQLHRAYGPLDLVGDIGPAGPAPVSVQAVRQAALQLSASLSDEAWRPVPNAVPSFVTVAGQKVNAAQFLRLMCEAWLAPGAPETQLRVHSHQMLTSATFLHPKQVRPEDQGTTWTLRPAPLRIAGL